MKTLLVYYATKDSTATLCENSARQGAIDVLEIREKYYRSMLNINTLGVCQALNGSACAIEEIDLDLDEYDKIIIATPIWALNPPPAINSFLYRTNLKDKDVIGMLIYAGIKPAKAGDILRKRIELAGGTCNDIISISTQELKNKACNDIVNLTKIDALV